MTFIMGIFSKLFNRKKQTAKPSVVPSLLKADALGCKPDIIDNRDHIKCSISKLSNDVNITETSLKTYAPPVRNQGTTAACTGYAATNAVYILLDKMHQKMVSTSHDSNINDTIDLSPLYVYWNARFKDYNGNSTLATIDSGATLRSTMQVLKEQGVIPNSIMSPAFYFPESKPPYKKINEDRNFKIKEYLRIPIDTNTSTTMKTVLSEERLPIIAGIRIYEEQSEVAEKTGYFKPVESRITAKALGGHAICITGYILDDYDNLWFEFINSWGTSYGNKGYCYIPESFVSDPFYMMDIWTFDNSYF